MMTNAKPITGRTAITVSDMLSIPLYKFADPTEGGREALPRGEALAICREDPALVYVDSDEVAAAIPHRALVDLHVEAANAGDEDQMAMCTRAIDGDLAARVACARAIAEVAGQR